ncbi:keratin, type I cytoskeletal 10 [Drosophila grimshawi]|uniref:GH21946 n=1 Tax=Drosophila grimshawi TaxID=7222 RepID=B4J8R2_DROGR|nr:keratin, type I cytoskeletal 10 [Drosophila grimshawi]EDW02352.1 GH21946 [Drosophila grimshawi]
MKQFVVLALTLCMALAFVCGHPTPLEEQEPQLTLDDVDAKPVNDVAGSRTARGFCCGGGGGYGGFPGGGFGGGGYGGYPGGGYGGFGGFPRGGYGGFGRRGGYGGGSASASASASASGGGYGGYGK